MSAPLSIAMVGCGNVGNALLSMLSDKDPKGKKFVFSFVATRSKGVVELDGASAMSSVKKISARGKRARADAQRIIGSIKESEFDVLVEATDANYEDAEPATSYLVAALGRGKDAVTCNKGPIALNLRRLESLGRRKGARIRFESTVMDGTPIFSLFRDAMPEAEVQSMRGVLNSTSNIVLDLLNDGLTIEDGIRRAQSLGIAESDVSKDLGGLDSAAKLVILSNVIAKADIGLDDVKIQGLTERSYGMARREDDCKRSSIRQVSTADMSENRFTVRIEPVKQGDFLYSCRGSSNAVSFRLSDFEEITLAERDPLPRETAYGICSDLISLMQ